jgi:tetratricopeptide (TPR) repeat protein
MSLERAEAFIQAGELADALDALDAHLEAHPDDHEARRLRIDVLVRLPAMAREAANDLALLPDLTGRDHLNRLWALTLGGYSPEAGAALVAEYRQRADLPAYARLLLTYLYAQGAAEQALELLADLPKTPDWLIWSGKFYTLQGDDRVAVEHYCSALDQMPPSDNALREIQRAGLLLLRADAYRRLKQYADADADYLAAEAIIPNDSTIAFHRGLLAFEQGDVQTAVDLCRSAMARAPEILRNTAMKKILREDERYAALYSAVMG